MFKPKNKNYGKVIDRTLPSLPYGVKVEDLDATGRLIPANFISRIDEMISEAKSKGLIKESENDLISKKNLDPNLKYSIIKLNDKDSQYGYSYYAIYKGAELGRGAFGKVVIAQNIETGKWYALKKQVLREDRKILTTKLAQTENKRLIDLNLSPKASINVRLSPSKQVHQYIILMHLEEGSTFKDLIEQQEYLGMSSIPDLIRLQISIELLKEGKKLVEQKGLLHRDVKEANCIANLSTFRTVLIDFGFTVQKDSNGEYKSEKPVGSLETMAAELRVEMAKPHDPDQKNKPNFIFNEKTEMYAYGIVIASLFNLWDNSDSTQNINDWKEKNFIVKEDNDLFIHNEALPKDAYGRKLLKDILNSVNNMTNYDKQDPEQKNRYSFTQAIEALENIKKKYIVHYGNAAKLKIGILDIKDYLNTQLDKEALSKTLDNFDEVVLIDTRGKEDGVNSYLAFKKQIEKIKETWMIVHDTVFIGSDKKAIQEKIMKYLKPIEEKLPIKVKPVECPLVPAPSVRKFL